MNMIEGIKMQGVSQTRVMIIDDTLEDIIIVKKAIQKIDPKCAFNYVFDGDEAIKMLEEIKETAEKFPHFIFLDLYMPRVGGFEILNWIKNDDKLCRIPVILFSTSEGTEEVTKAYASRANAFISKQSVNTNFVLTIQATYRFWSEIASVLE